MRALAAFERLSTAVDRATDAIATALVVLFTGVVLAGVVFRYALGAPLTWSDEVARFTMVWMTFLAGAVVLRRGQHVAIDILIEAMPSPRVAAAVRLAVHAAIGWLLVVLILHGLRLAQAVSIQTTPALGIPQTLPYLAVPVGATLMLLQVGTLLLADLLLLAKRPLPAREPDA